MHFDSTIFETQIAIKHRRGTLRNILPAPDNKNILIEALLLDGPPATGLEFKLSKNGFSEAPQTSQVPRTSLWKNFGEKIFWLYDLPRTP